MTRFKWLAAVLALGMLAAACGRDDDDDAAAPETTAAAPETTAAAPETTTAPAPGGDTTTTGAEATTTAAPADPCDGVALEATEIGVSEDTITILVMADVGSPLAPGLFQGSIDGVKAWAEYTNANGGLACRQVEVVEADSQLNPTETTNGYLKACDEALAMVGSTALFVTEVVDATTCPDQAGEPTGIPDIAERAVSAAHQCAPTTFSMSGIGGSCPFAGNAPRDYTLNMGFHQYMQELAGEPLHGVVLIPADLPSTIESTMPTAQLLTEMGVTLDGRFGVSGRADQATYAPYVLTMAQAESNYAVTISNDQSMIKWRNEALVQGVDVPYWTCSLACYTEAFLEAGEIVEGTYLWMSFLPFEEADTNEELGHYVDTVDEPVSWGAGAWSAGALLKQVVDDIVAADGPNAITRSAVLEGLRATETFDANGWFGTLDFVNRVPSGCFVVLQAQGGEFVRVHPEERGTLDCEADNLASLEGYDSAAEFVN